MTNIDKSAIKTDYTKPFEFLSIGSTISNFKVVNSWSIEEIEGYAYLLEHTPSGARVMWLACSDTNKSFSISFKTPPTDSTGVFHILEHSVLCGSDKYPVKEPFVNLIKTSMNTFLNAMTFPDKTVYPVASTNERDLENLMDVYLDAVLHPAIYTNKHIFEQEGWHFELNEDNTELSYNGVVFNEMQGALSEPDSVVFDKVSELLFPDTAYRFESGGDPKVIPELTYEGFLDNHKRHYQLANSYTTFYGNLDIERQLERLNEAFENKDDSDAGEPNTLGTQEAVVVDTTTITMKSAPENSMSGFGYVIGDSSDRKRCLAANILMDTLLGSNESPLKKKLLSEGVCSDVDFGLLESFSQPFVLLELRGTKDDDCVKAEEIINSFSRRLVKRGIDHDLLKASIAQAQFELREADYGYPKGVAYSIAALNSWLYDDTDPVSQLRFKNELDELEQDLENGYFENLLDELIVSSKHHCAVNLVCDPNYVDEDGKEAQLASKLESLTEDEKQKINDDVVALRKAQETPDAPEDVAKLPQLALEDIKDAEKQPVSTKVNATLPCYHNDVETHGIDYIYAYFSLNPILFDLLPQVSVLSAVLGKLDTERHTAAQIDNLVQANLGRLNFFTEGYANFNDDNDVTASFIVSCATLSEKVDEAHKIIPEILLTTKFDDKERIKNILTQQKIGMEQTFISAGHTCAMRRCETYFTPLAILAEKLGGVEYYYFLRDLLKNFDARFTFLKDTLEYLQKTLFVANNVEFSFTGDIDDCEYFWDTAGSFGLNSTEKKLERMLKVPEPQVSQEAFILPTNVCYVGYSRHANNMDDSLTGAWNVASKALTFDYLWNEVRIKGGAYGCGFRAKRTGMLENYSYRDPQTDQTIERYLGEDEWLANWNPTQSELTGYIVSSVAALDAPVAPRALGRRIDLRRQTNTPENWRDTVRRQQIECTQDQFEKLATILSEAKENNAVCIFGNEDLINNCKVDHLKKIRLMEG